MSIIETLAGTATLWTVGQSGSPISSHLLSVTSLALTALPRTHRTPPALTTLPALTAHVELGRPVCSKCAPLPSVNTSLPA